MHIRGVSFDFGDTIVAIDERLLLEKIRLEGLDAELARLEAAVLPARLAYDAAIANGNASHPWKPFMKALLEHAGAQPAGSAPQEAASAAEIDRVTHALWLDQPRHNLWRKLLPGIPALARELAAAGVPIGILTNSEGKARTLVDELGLDDAFQLVVDSGVIGVAKPDARIFHAFADAIGLPPAAIVHVGDSLQADVLGARAAGMQAIWFAGRSGAAPPGVTVCQDATELRRALSDLGLFGPSRQ